ncbi:WD40 repeat-like protein [Neurospora crassa]|nr:WD40 repeat-like protein [Neurospora crassa]
MLFSKNVKSSAHCLPSPDGRYIATLFPTLINVRSVQSWELIHVVRLPQDFIGPFLSFQWSPSSRLLLVASFDQLRVFSALDGNYHATIRNPVAPHLKPTYIDFGASDTEICVMASFGLKLAVFDLNSSKAIEIGSPKFSSSTAVRRGFSFRPQSNHLALLTRTAGKDMISIHAFPSRELQRSWAPDTIDAQGLLWSPDGRWLVVWESPALGHKVVFYTPDGNLFKIWSGPVNPTHEEKDFALGAGVKTVQFSPDARLLAISDHSRSLSIVNMASTMEVLRLQHPNNLVPKGTLQIWQERIGISHGPIMHTFIRASQAISPPPRPQQAAEQLSGCVTIAFDLSSNLIATRIEEFPSTVWIWDVQAAVLRAVLLFHGSVSTLSWHPHVRETLLIRCEGDHYNSVVFVWDPLSEGPQSVDFSQQLSGFKAVGKWHASWLGLDASTPLSIFYSDTQNYVLASLADSDRESLPWINPRNPQGGDGPSRAESPLELVPATEDEADEEDALQTGDDGDIVMEDTYGYKQ